MQANEVNIQALDLTQLRILNSYVEGEIKFHETIYNDDVMKKIKIARDLIGPEEYSDGHVSEEYVRGIVEFLIDTSDINPEYKEEIMEALTKV